MVFNGSDLGKEYSAKGIMERMAQKMIKKPEISLLQKPINKMSLLPKSIKQQDLAGEKKEPQVLKRQLNLL